MTALTRPARRRLPGGGGLASVLAHAGALAALGLAGPRLLPAAAPPSPEPLDVTLLEPPPAAGLPEPRLGRPAAKPRPSSPLRRPASAPAPPSRKAPPAAAVARTPRDAAVPAAPAAQGAPASESLVSEAASGSAAASASETAADAARGAFSETLRARYLALVRARLDAHKREPRRPAEGVVRLRFTIAGNGAPQGVELAGDDPDLKAAALASLRAAAPFSPPPPELAERPLEIEIPIVYELETE